MNNTDAISGLGGNSVANPEGVEYDSKKIIGKNLKLGIWGTIVKSFIRSFSVQNIADRRLKNQIAGNYINTYPEL
jgi:hypothetical protein